MRSLFKRTAAVCLLLILWSAVAAIAHHHSSQIDFLKCPVCAAAHSASPNSITPLAKVSFVPESTVEAEPLAAKQRVESFALSVRPPPEA
jgi:hypothetical protein